MGAVVSFREARARRLSNQPPNHWRSHLVEVSETRLSIRDYERRYFDALAREGSKSIRSIKSALDRLPDDFRAIELEALEQREVSAMVRWMRSERKPDGTARWSKTTIRMTHAALAAMLTRAVDDGFLRANPAKGLPRGVLPPNRVRTEYRAKNQVFPTDEISRLLSSPLVAFPRRVIYGLALFTGLRIGEAIGARWSQWDEAFSTVQVGDEDLVLGRFLVERQWKRKAGEFDVTKTDDVRDVPVHPELAKLLSAWRGDGWPGVRGRRRSRPTGEDLIVPGLSNRTGKLVAKDEDKLREAFNADLKQLGIRVRNFHSLRKTFKTRAVNAGANETAIESLIHRVDDDVYNFWDFERLALEVLKFPVRIELVTRQLDLFRKDH